MFPARPHWPSGSVRGLRARGGVTVDLHWERGALTEARITTSQPDTVVAVVCPSTAGPLWFDREDGSAITPDTGCAVESGGEPIRVCMPTPGNYRLGPGSDAQSGATTTAFDVAVHTH
ncbi:glycoside hydrolase family 95-like protein [Streptacidiphilus sp. MAP5-3]|uniref:glycoside hydrolase family 95-like protein n=1 Tax=unclassified Streptacidiphilus TaxID=2643834 RepID=UPI003518CCE3